MAEWVICPFAAQPPKGFIVPSIVAFAADYRTGGGTVKGYGLVKVNTWIDRVTAIALPNVTVVSADDYATVLTNQQRNTLNSRLSSTDLGITIAAGATVLVALKAIALACGLTDAFDPLKV